MNNDSAHHTPTDTRPEAAVLLFPVGKVSGHPDPDRERGLNADSETAALQRATETDPLKWRGRPEVDSPLAG
jgi:hypothetical protein